MVSQDAVPFMGTSGSNPSSSTAESAANVCRRGRGGLSGKRVVVGFGRDPGQAGKSQA